MGSAPLPVRIARVMTRLNLGGPARQALACDPLLAQRGHEVRLFCGQPEVGEGDLFESFRERGLDVQRVPGLGRRLSPLGEWRAGRALRRALRDFGPEIVHTHASKAGLHGRRAALALVRRGARIGLVHSFHGHVLEGYFPEGISRLLIGIERRLARRTQRIVAVSHATADDLVRLGVCAEERLFVSPPGVELGPLLAIEGRSGVLRELIGAGPERFVVGVVGRLAQVKQPLVALAVFELLTTRFPQLELVFIGDGELRRSLERRIVGGSEAVRSRVHLIGARSSMPELLADLDALLLTSRSEGMPVALIEAAAAARPVVAMRVGGVPELIAHERTGLLGESEDELAYHLANLLEHPEQGRAMGLRARLRIEKYHSAKALANRLEALYLAVREEVA